jgi:hypothetical protein
MSWTFRPGRASSPLWGACGLALALHALVLSFVHLRQTRQAPPVALPSRDNTPELLQFSSLPTPMANLAVLPLPQSRVLPPPAIRRQPSPNRARRLVPRREESPASTPERRREPGSGPAVSRLADQEGPTPWEKALAQLNSVVSQEAIPPEPSLPPLVPSERKAAAEGKPAVVHALAAPLRESYQALWQAARPAADPRFSQSLGQSTINAELRTISPRQARAAAVPIGHGQGVVLPESVLLFWWQGETLYVLQSQRQATRPTAAAGRS